MSHHIPLYTIKQCKVLHIGHGMAILNTLISTYKMNGQKLAQTKEEIDIGVSVRRKNLMLAGQCLKSGPRTAQAVLLLGQLARAFHYRYRHVFCTYVPPHLELAVPACAPWQQGEQVVSEEGAETCSKNSVGPRWQNM